MNTDSPFNFGSLYGLINSIIFIILGHLSVLLPSLELTYILQNTSYTMAILVAFDALTGNPIKRCIKSIFKKENND